MERLFYVSQVFSTCLIEVYNAVVKVSPPDQKAERFFSNWEAANPVTLYIYIFQLV